MPDDIPVACNLGAIEKAGGREARGHHEEVSKRLLSRVHRSVEREDGLCLIFEADVETVSLAGEFIARERLCCPFIHFRLEIDPGADTFDLILGGDAEATAFLEAELSKLDV